MENDAAFELLRARIMGLDDCGAHERTVRRSGPDGQGATIVYRHLGAAAGCSECAGKIVAEFRRWLEELDVEGP